MMWLNDHGLDIRCVRLKPHQDNGRVLVDVQQVIPLPDASDYMVKIREKEAQERTARREQSVKGDLCARFWPMRLQRARPRTNLHADTTPGAMNWLPGPRQVGRDVRVRVRETRRVSRTDPLQPCPAHLPGSLRPVAQARGADRGAAGSAAGLGAPGRVVLADLCGHPRRVRQRSRRRYARAPRRWPQ